MKKENITEMKNLHCNVCPWLGVNPRTGKKGQLDNINQNLDFPKTESRQLNSHTILNIKYKMQNINKL